MKKFFFGCGAQSREEMVSVFVGASNANVNFLQIDPLIKRITAWTQEKPTFATLEAPKSKIDDILTKLKAHGEITSVNGEMTLHGLTLLVVQIAGKNNQEMVSIPVEAFSMQSTDIVNFQRIDPLIKQITPWHQPSPRFTTIEVPKDRMNEIIAKLKTHGEIRSVNNELTVHGQQAAEYTRKLREEMFTELVRSLQRGGAFK